MSDIHPVDSHFNGGYRVKLEGPAFMVGGLTTRSLEVSHYLRRLFDRFVHNEHIAARSQCPQAGRCALELLRIHDDGGDTASAKYHCPRAEQGCGELVVQAAGNVAELADKATEKVRQLVEQQLESVTEVTEHIQQPS